MPVLDHAFSTAGHYERSFVAGGKRYRHIVDLRTGYPVSKRLASGWRRQANWQQNCYNCETS
jgi:thiamine biosynthesis lipoprotein